MPNTRKISKFLSFVLRHKPDAIGLTLDDEGWADVAELIAKATVPFDLADLEHVVAENDKKRFAFSPDHSRIRASQGHSLAIDLGLEAVVPPETLFHGTVDKFLVSIREQGLKPQSRQHVHLSKDVETARIVGARRGKPVILTVGAGDMHLKGHKFYLSANGVWLTDKVPAEFLSGPQ
jgi:putative RNA 2'-phosphotransferase